ncbi:hypothetical protein [Arthrobacter burdickii]|uniref:Uncharacterized protein n=1 Tax=Arthrobacter burdickii TaxID=3035920 RepID=A0ABT8K363_9MICC|nr:hypothetical protein [Arthrobacter burdickii]MDN4611794.1 hypothetical protein [Arthrobacter burdickii]
MSDAYESQVDGRMHLAEHALEKVIERDISPAELAEALSRLNRIYLQAGCRSHPIGKVRRGTGPFNCRQKHSLLGLIGPWQPCATATTVQATGTAVGWDRPEVKRDRKPEAQRAWFRTLGRTEGWLS